MKFAWIPAGTFLMGSPADEEGTYPDETQHKVTLSKGFYLAIHPVSLASWRAVMGNGNPSYLDDLPVPVSWEDSQGFLRNLSERESHAYRLPTEAEWEYACRAGTTTPYYFGETALTSIPPNGWGLHDMHGDVWQWCADWFGDYPPGEIIDPKGPQGGDCHVLRGGSFLPGFFVRSGVRTWESSMIDSNKVGFRAARDWP